MTEERLSLLQHWMKTVVTERGGLEEKLSAASRLHGLSAEEVVAERGGLSARRRLGIYATGYVLRLLDCMRADFPALRGFLGDPVFDAFARAYIIERPPGSPSLYDLSADFPRFLEETRPKDARLAGDLSAMLDLPPEIARLERTRAEVMRARGAEDEAGGGESPSPLALFAEGATLRTTPCLRLLELKFPLVEFVACAERGERPSKPPPPRASLVAVGRSNYLVRMAELEPWQFALLRACERPAPLYEAVRHAARETGRETGRVLAEAAMWLPVATELGFLRRVPSD